MPRKEDNVSATLRAIGVLESLVAAERPATLAELTAVLRLPKPTLYRMLAMLEGAKLVAREPGARRYTPGPRLAALGRNVMLNGSLRTARHSILSRLVGEMLAQRMRELSEYDHAMRAYLAKPPVKLGRAGKRYPSREEVHDRARLR